MSTKSRVKFQICIKLFPAFSENMPFPIHIFHHLSLQGGSLWCPARSIPPSPWIQHPKSSPLKQPTSSSGFVKATPAWCRPHKWADATGCKGWAWPWQDIKISKENFSFFLHRRDVTMAQPARSAAILKKAECTWHQIGISHSSGMWPRCHPPIVDETSAAIPSMNLQESWHLDLSSANFQAMLRSHARVYQNLQESLQTISNVICLTWNDMILSWSLHDLDKNKKSLKFI